MSTEPLSIGIDFGTSNSAMAWFNREANRAEIILNAEGEAKTPSLVYFGESEVLVGKPAEDLLEDSEHYEEEERLDITQRVVKSIKRNLVSPAGLSIPGRRPVLPVEVVTWILGKLKRDAEEEHFQEEVERAVIACPAAFSMPERETLLEAAFVAGFHRVELLKEPVAVVLAATRLGPRIGKGVLIYDLGAGFKVSVVGRDEEGSLSVLETYQDGHCGGEEFDLALYNHCDRIARETLGRPIGPVEHTIDPVFLRQCRSRKEVLSLKDRARFSSLLFSEDGSVQRFKYEVDGETFESLIREQVEKTVRQAVATVEWAKGQGYEVDTLILTGGSSRVPLVRRQLEETLPVKPLDFAGIDHAVALGAAYHAYDLWKRKPDKDSQVAEYRRSLAICWQDGKLTEIEAEWLESMAKQELQLSLDTAARIECEVMGDTIEGIRRNQ